MSIMETDQADNGVVQARSHFEHSEEAETLLAVLLENEALEAVAKASSRLKDILDLYQEQPNLMDPYLENLVQPAVAKLRTWIDISVADDTNEGVPEQAMAIFRYLYLLTKTRGYKTIVKFMSHEVNDLEPVFDYIAKLSPTNAKIWEARYICFVWLSLICMIPFDLSTVDSSTEETNKTSLISRMMKLCKRYLKCTGKERDGASLLLARLLSRRDLCGELFVPYIEWSKERMSTDADVFETIGILTSLCFAYQLAPREVLLPRLDDTVMPLLTMDFFEKHANNSVVRKLRTKLTQRVGLCFLKPKVASWRYERGHRSLLQNLASVSNGLSAEKNERTEEKEEEDDDEEVPESLEVIMDILLNGLRDKDTIVRWSAAKGIGRITQRLQRELAGDVVGTLLELFEENTFDRNGSLELTAVSDHTWHGALLAIAELARRGLLLPDRLEETIPWVVRGLKFDLKRGSHSIGAHVRDAACYVCWSFARAYAANILEPFVAEIAKHLVVVSVFDREINVRRASSAAFQENVGRQGIFPNGIDIIQLADYFLVGNRSQAFLHVAVEIAKFKDYRYCMIDHLVHITLKHWDKAMRMLASKSLYEMVSLDPMYFMDHVLSELVPLTTAADMQISHGALMAVGDVCLGISHCGRKDPLLASAWDSKKDLFSMLGNVISGLPKKSVDSFGSEHIREAACYMIQCLSDINMQPIGYQDKKTTTLDTWKSMVKSSLERKEENVQEYAVAAFGSMASTYGVQKEDIMTYLKYIEPTRMIYGRRGYSLALGTLEYKDQECLHSVLKGLCSAAIVDKNHQFNDIESKRNAVVSLHRILIGLGNNLKFLMASTDCDLVLDTLDRCLKDYSTDQRGDVGSWVRTASMECLHDFIPLLAKLDVSSTLIYLTSESRVRVVAALLKQSVERIDRVRASAGAVLCDFLEDGSGIDMPDRDTLKTYITRKLDFMSPAELYPSLIHILSLPHYRAELLTGLVTSAGGLTETLVRHSSACLIDYTNKLSVEDRKAIFMALLDMFGAYDQQDRVIIPLMEVIGLMYASGALSVITDESMHQTLFGRVRKVAYRSKNIKKLLSAVHIYVGLIALHGTTVKTKALQQLLSYLVHAFPRIRTEVSDQLYTFLSLLDDDEMTPETSEAEEILTDTDWSAPTEEIRPIRDKLYSLFNVEKPTVLPKKP